MKDEFATRLLARTALEQWTRELDDEAVQLLAAHKTHVDRLDSAVAAVAPDRLVKSLDRVTNAIPLALSVETASIRLRDTDGDRVLHHLTAVGLPTSDRRRLSIEPMTVAKARAVLALGARHSLARNLGLRWLRGVWLEGRHEVIGVVLLGSRTNRRPTESQLDHLQHVADSLALRLEGFNRSTRALRRASVEVARSLVANHAPVPEDRLLAGLRARERAILDLYADGMTTSGIADLLVISQHTVRTHVKNALRRLGVHSREEAIELIRRDRIINLV